MRQTVPDGNVPELFSVKSRKKNNAAQEISHGTVSDEEGIPSKRKRKRAKVPSKTTSL